MTTKTQPIFYQPVFGNDNGMAQPNMVDVAVFSVPSLRLDDVALNLPANAQVRKTGLS